MNAFTHNPVLQEGPRIYRGRTVDELIPRIVAELGEDAIVIRHQRGLTGGFAGFFQRPFVEIEARRGGGQLLDRYDEDAAPALPGQFEDDHAPVEVEVDEWAANPFAAALADAEAAVRAAEPAVPPDLDAALAAALADAEAAGLTAEPAVPADDAALAAALADAEAEAEAAELPSAPTVPPDDDPALAHTASFPLAETGIRAAGACPPASAATGTDQGDTCSARIPESASAAGACPPTSAETGEDAYPPASAEPPDSPSSAVSLPRGRAEDAIERTPLERALLDVGFDERFAGEAIDTAAAHLLPLIEPSSPSPLTQAVRRALQQRIPACPPLPPGPATIALVGPGGSGKSACCAALLDAYHRRSVLPAACAAFVQNGIGGPPALEVVLDPHCPAPVPVEDPGAARALRSAREAGLLLLDTPSLSPADPASIDALAATLERLAPDRVVLALPATLGAKPAARLLEAYRPLGTGALALTHTDGTDQLGVVVQVACTFGLAPAYLLECKGSGWALTQIDPDGLLDRLLPPR